MEMTQDVWSVVLGVVAMVVTSLVKNPGWTRRAKTAVFTGVAIAAAVAQHAANDDLALDGDLLKTAGVVLGTATTMYNMYFKDTRVNERLEKTRLR